jgi:serine/threonine-protein kinase
VQQVFEFDRFYLDASDRMLSHEGKPVAVSPKVLDGLILLLENAGRLVRKEQIHNVLWPDTFVEDVTLARVISDLRRILAQYSSVQYIETVKKHGYRFAGTLNSVAPRAPLTSRKPALAGSGEAADLVRRAWHAAGRWSPAEVAKGLDYARGAIAANPAYADAHAVLAYIYLYAGFGFLPGTDAFPRAKAAANTALELDPLCANAFAVSGMLKLVLERDLKGAEELFRKSVELAPHAMPGHFGYSHYLLIVGRFGEARDHALRAQELDALSSAVTYHIAGIFYYSGEYEAAVAQLLKFEYLDPEFLAAHQMLAILYARLNRAAKALNEAEKAVELSGNSTRGKATLAMVNALLGRRLEAQTILRELRAEPEVPGTRWPYALAAIHSYLNERDAAFLCLDQACKEGDGALIYLKYDPHFIELREDQRFTEMVKRIGLQSQPPT